MTDTIPRDGLAKPEAGRTPAGNHQPRRRPRLRTAVAVAVALLAVVAGAGGGYGYSMSRPTVYGAEAQVLLTPRAELTDAAVDRAMVTQVIVVTAPSVLRPVADSAGVPLAELQGAVSAEIVGRSNILRITVGDSDQAKAVTLVERVAAEYVRQGVPTATDGTPPLKLTVLTSGRAVDGVLQPRPRRATAAGLLVGLLVAAAAIVVLLRPWPLVRPEPYWR
jgi:capsular polysaccharide biosynthesis protein